MICRPVPDWGSVLANRAQKRLRGKAIGERFGGLGHGRLFRSGYFPGAETSGKSLPQARRASARANAGAGDLEPIHPPFAKRPQPPGRVQEFSTIMLLR